MKSHEKSAAIPKVSIGVPVYNGEIYIREALDSLLAQTFTNFELIISDNASTDGTEAICRKYAAHDPRIRYIRQPENRGALANFKYLLDEAAGEYFQWLGSDDCLSAVSLSELVTRIEEGFDCVFPDVDIVFQNGRLPVTNCMGIFNRVDGVYEFCRASIYRNNYQVYGLFVTNVLRRHWEFLAICDNMKCYNEGLFVHAISALTRCAYVPGAKLIFRRHSANVSSVVRAPRLLLDFLTYSARSHIFFAKVNSLSAFQKVNILSLLLFCHTKYAAYLIGASIKQLTYQIIRRCNQ